MLLRKILSSTVSASRVSIRVIRSLIRSWLQSVPTNLLNLVTVGVALLFTPH